MVFPKGFSPECPCIDFLAVPFGWRLSHCSCSVIPWTSFVLMNFQRTRFRSQSLLSGCLLQGSEYEQPVKRTWGDNLGDSSLDKVPAKQLWGLEFISQHPHACLVGVKVCLCSYCSEAETGIPRADWIGRPAEMVSSGFKQQTLPQYTR